MIVLPARLESSRLPKKLLKVANGKTILQHTFEAASCSRLADQVLVAVDDQSLANEVERFAGSWELTSTQCQSGTDRWRAGPCVALAPPDNRGPRPLPSRESVASSSSAAHRSSSDG